jgi:flagellar secretion chaperone FliS
MLRTGFQAYRRMDVLTADPKKLIIMCYEAMIRNLKTVKEKFGSNEFELKADAVQNTLDIITELRSALDFERGGMIAKNLDALYVFWSQHILTADRTKNLTALDDVAVMMEEIKSAFETAYFGHTLEAGQNVALPIVADNPV